MVTGIQIAHDSSYPLEELKVDGLADYQRVVGGYAEPVHIDFPRLTIFANEEGKVRGLPINRRATCLWWLFSPNARGRDTLVGDVLLVGARRGRQSITNLPDDVRELLLRASKFGIETKLHGDVRNWHKANVAFLDFFEAAITALNMFEQSAVITDVHVIGSK